MGKLEKFVRRLERFDAQAYGAQKQVKGQTDSFVVIDDVDDGRVGCFGFVRRSAGRSSSHLDTLGSRNAVVPRWHGPIFNLPMLLRLIGNRVN
jgi:hypothetical protein